MSLVDKFRDGRPLLEIMASPGKRRLRKQCDYVRDIDKSKFFCGL